MPRARSAFRILPALAVAMLAMMLAGCQKQHQWNQKITVVVETPSGERSGSSVMNVEWTGGIPFIVGDARGGGYKLQGEAPVVDLGNGRYLFALLRGMELRGMERLAHQVIADGRGGMADAGRTIKRAAGTYEIPESRYPMLVTFDRISDPMSVRRVDPTSLAAAFGPGYALKAITLEITDEPMTGGKVESLLGWWLDYRDGPYNSMKSLQLPNDSPRGWDHLPAREFWSLDRIQEFNKRSK